MLFFGSTSLKWKIWLKREGGGGAQTLVAVIVNVFLRDSIVT